MTTGEPSRRCRRSVARRGTDAQAAGRGGPCRSSWARRCRGSRADAAAPAGGDVGWWPDRPKANQRKSGEDVDQRAFGDRRQPEAPAPTRRRPPAGASSVPTIPSTSAAAPSNRSPAAQLPAARVASAACGVIGASMPGLIVACGRPARLSPWREGCAKGPERPLRTVGFAYQPLMNSRRFGVPVTLPLITLVVVAFRIQLAIVGDV